MNEELLPVTVVVSRTAKPGREKDYEAFLQGVTAASRRFPGHLGANVLHAAGSRDYTIVFRFDTVAHLQAWEESEERAAWLAKVDDLCELESRHVDKLTGMETWFQLPGRTVKPPPKHKMAVVSWVAAFPIVQVMSTLVVPRLDFLPPLGRGVVMSVTMVLLMTYVVMPRLTKLLARWLYP